MKKVILTLGVLATVGFTSCKKCEECHCIKLFPRQMIDRQGFIIHLYMQRIGVISDERHQP